MKKAQLIWIVYKKRGIDRIMLLKLILFIAFFEIVIFTSTIIILYIKMNRRREKIINAIIKYNRDNLSDWTNNKNKTSFTFMMIRLKELKFLTDKHDHTFLTTSQLVDDDDILNKILPYL